MERKKENPFPLMITSIFVYAKIDSKFKEDSLMLMDGQYRNTSHKFEINLEGVLNFHKLRVWFSPSIIIVEGLFYLISLCHFIAKRFLKII